jgi:serine/threonine protein kinase
VLLWESDDNSAFLPQLPKALSQLLNSLGKVGLVHGDIRPWNIFYDTTNKEFKIIDWGFSFFIGENLTQSPFWHLRDHLKSRGHNISAPATIDTTDAEKTLQVVGGSLRYEDAWFHNAEEMTWRPPWAAH